MHSRQEQRLRLSNQVYARLADELLREPERFTAVQDGLFVSTSVVASALSDVPRAAAVALAFSDGYLLRATHAYWLLLPCAFDCAEEWLPRGVSDCRHLRASDLMVDMIAA